MIALILFAIFLIAYFTTDKKYVSLAVFIIGLAIPDEIPFVDEVVQLALLIKAYKK